MRDGIIEAPAEPHQELESVDITLEPWTGNPVIGSFTRCARSLTMTVDEWRAFSARVEAAIVRDQARQTIEGLRGPEEGKR